MKKTFDYEAWAERSQKAGWILMGEKGQWAYWLTPGGQIAIRIGKKTGSWKECRAGNISFMVKQ